VTAPARATSLVLLGLLGADVGAGAGCARADLYPVTRGAVVDGGMDGGMDGIVPVACPSPALPSGDTSHTVQVGADTRSYVLHVAPAYDGTKPVPLVVDFHGIGSPGSDDQRS